MNESFHMTPEEFRKWGYAMVDWVADYQKNIEQFPVLSQLSPGHVRSQLPAEAPLKGESFETILPDLERIILPGITHWQSPKFFAYFPANASGPSILGELLSAGLGVQGMLWATSPACTELETHVLDWLVDMLGLPGRFKSSSTGGGVIQDTASSAVLCALIAARERATRGRSNQAGASGSLTAYASEHAHSSLEKGMTVAGMGRRQLRLLPCDDKGAMRLDALVEAICADRKQGLVPCFVCASLGTTSCMAFDPLPEIATVCREAGVWLHVDAALSGSASLCPEFRHFQNGVEFADSYAFNPHKWMFTNFDCDCFYVSDRTWLTQALTIMPEYLRNAATESAKVIDYRDWQIPLGRRFRALKLWFVIRHYGVEGLQFHIRRHVELARQFAGWVRDSDDFFLTAPQELNLVCFAHRGGNEISKALLQRLNASGELFLTHTVLRGIYTLRLCVGQTNTTERHVRHAWEKIRG